MPTDDEIRQFCRGRLAHYKVPRYVKFVDSFPQTVTGKIQKYKIRELMIDELKLEERKPLRDFPRAAKRGVGLSPFSGGS